MIRRTLLRGAAPLAVLFLAVGLAPSRISGQITRIELEVVESPALGGTSFGEVGTYDRLRGVFHGEADPSDPANAGIVNLDLAPRNERGRVEYATTVELHLPTDRTRWNGAIHHTVPNRGGAGAADRALLERGFALVRVGWQGDLTPTATNLVAHLPVATRTDGTPLTGTALEEFIFNNDEARSVGVLSYPAASLDPSRATLTVRPYQFSRRQTPEDLRWEFDGADRIVIERPAGFEGGAIYEFIYEARDPIVMGLGFAAMRDAISFLRYETADRDGTPNPLLVEGRLPTWAISLGISQSGRTLRDMLYQGFNADLEGRIVFDGMHPDIAGSRKTFTNYPFSQPGRWQRQHEDHLFPGDQFPFTYGILTDPLSGRTDGILARCLETDTCPKIVHTDGEAELWQARASLVVTDPLGREDLVLPENVRVYLIAGTQHGGGAGVYTATPRTGMCMNLSNPLSLSEIRTALSVALWEWVSEGREPPPSRYPTIAARQLLRPEATGFPDLPTSLYTANYNPLFLHDHTTVPPSRGEPYTVLVGRVNAHGNMMDGVRPLHLQVPIGTFTGWNLRAAGYAEEALCGGTGSFFPLLETQNDRSGSWDDRPSFMERYGSAESYLAELEAAAAQLVEERFLLPTDAADMLERARNARLAGTGSGAAP